MNHVTDITRRAMAGTTTWEYAMATFCKTFTRATIRYCDVAAAAAARTWLGGASPADA